MADLSSSAIWTYVAVFVVIFLFSLIINATLLKLISNTLGSSLRHPKFRHFLTSLLLGNLLVTVTGLPAWVAVLASNNTTQSVQPGSENISNIFYYSLDIFHSLLVFIHIVVLMFERLYAIGWSIHHRISPDHQDYVICFIIWLTSGVLTTLAFLMYYLNNFKELALTTLSVCFPFPILITCIFFVVILVKKKNNFTIEMRRIELQMSIVIAILLLVCVTLHVPLHVIYVLLNSFASSSIPYHVTVLSLRCIQYSSTVFIPLVFMLGIADFRSELHLWCFKCCSINETSRNDFLHMDMPRLDSKCVLTNTPKYTPKEQVELAFTNEIHS